MGKFKDITEQRFGKLIAKRYAYTKNKKAYWYCDCDCGTKDHIVSGIGLRFGQSKSCGCLQKERSREVSNASRKGNIYDLETYDYGVGYASNTHTPFYFDLKDYDLIKEYTWSEDMYGYIFTEANGKHIALHRLIMLKNDIDNVSIKIDHINGRKSRNDNRRTNLRLASSQENNRNKTYTSISQSGFIGVSYRKDRNKWRAYITISGLQIPLGVYTEFTEAVKARLEAEVKYFKEFAYHEHKKVLDFINDGGILEPYNRQQIENIMNS